MLTLTSSANDLARRVVGRLAALSAVAGPTPAAAPEAVTTIAALIAGPAHLVLAKEVGRVVDTSVAIIRLQLRLRDPKIVRKQKSR